MDWLPHSASRRAAERFGRWFLVCAAMLTMGCQAAQKMAQPSNHRNWEPLYSQLATAEFVGNDVTIRNVRHCNFMDKESYVPNWYDKKFRLTDIQGVDFIVMPFPKTPILAHTQLSFELARPGQPPEHLAVSVETRKEEGEGYAAWKGSARQYELIYIVADERDAIESQTNVDPRDVYLYRSTATPEQAQRLFVDVMSRANQLAIRPEFYDTLTNNCTTNIVDHINRIQPRRLTYDLRVLLPGMSDKLAYDQGLIVRHGTFEETQARAYITAKAQQHAGRSDFSQLIRR